MKEILLLIACTGILSLAVSSQSLSLSWEDGDIPDKSEFPILVNPPVDVINAYIYIKNTTGESIDIKVKKIVQDTMPGTTNTFCWGGSCYPPTTYVSPGSTTIGPGITNTTDFSGDYFCNGVLGTSKIWYVFFDERDPNDSASVLVNFIAGYAGLTDDLKKKIELSEAFPNPASNSTSFNYSLPSGIKNGSLVVRNLLGSKVKETIITGQQGKFVLNTSDLQKGIYLYSLIVDNQTILTRKLLVNR
ncbi:MAG: T9SS type A sorting domain-containing protein [Bacteroidetes bacterium]|nr:T9SS type A sorting domain-containing protein [Bacteroidota bacterium]